MLLERMTVSRKTPGDGRLEVTKRAAAKLEKLGASFNLEMAGHRSQARLATMTCTCRGEDKPHVHYFIESASLKQLAPGSHVDLELDAESAMARIGPSQGSP